MSVANQLGFGPTRTVSYDHDQDRYIVTVTAPKVLNPSGKSVTVTLTPPQFTQYKRWQAGALIQNALKDLSTSDREKLMSGLDDEDFAAACGPEE